MARLDRAKPDLRLIQGGKKDTNWQQIFNISITMLVVLAYVLVLTGR